MPDLALPPDLERRIAHARARLRLGYPIWLRPFLFRAVEGITLGRSIFLAEEVALWPTERRESLIRHELVHVDQVRRLGFFPFLTLYLLHYFRLRLRGLGKAEAYWNHPLELEARREEKGKN